MIKNPYANAGDAGAIVGSGRAPWVGNGNPFWYSCLENSMNRRWLQSQKVGHDWAHTAHKIFRNVILGINFKIIWRKEGVNEIRLVDTLKNYFLTVLGILCCAQAFSSCSKQGLLPSCGVQTSHCGGLFCCGAWEQLVMAHGLSCFGACRIFLGQELNQWPQHSKVDS